MRCVRISCANIAGDGPAVDVADLLALLAGYGGDDPSTDINGAGVTGGVAYKPYDRLDPPAKPSTKGPTKGLTPPQTHGHRVLGGVAGMGGVTDSGPASWSMTSTEVAWAVRELRKRNMTDVIVQM